MLVMAHGHVLTCACPRRRLTSNSHATAFIDAVLMPDVLAAELVLLRPWVRFS